MDPCLLEAPGDHEGLPVLKIPSIQECQMGPLLLPPLEALQDLAALETLASHLCQEAHLCPFHPEALLVLAHQELPEQERPPSVRKPLVLFHLYPEGGDAIWRAGH